MFTWLSPYLYCNANLHVAINRLYCNGNSRDCEVRNLSELSSVGGVVRSGAKPILEGHCFSGSVLIFLTILIVGYKKHAPLCDLEKRGYTLL